MRLSLLAKSVHGESERLSTCLLSLLVASPPTSSSLTRICCPSCRGEQGSAWVAGQHTGPPWLAPVILPSHSSARDINNNSTSGFTLLSPVNPFLCSPDCYCSCWQGLKPRQHPPPLCGTLVPFLLLSVFISLSQTLLLFPLAAA